MSSVGGWAGGWGGSVSGLGGGVAQSTSDVLGEALMVVVSSVPPVCDVPDLFMVY